MTEPRNATGGGGRKARPCPALEGTISPADCGAQRGSRLPCPGTCPYFPFGPAGYDLLPRVEERWFEKTRDRIDRALGPARFRELLRDASSQATEADMPLLVEWVVPRALTREKDRSGRTVAESWAAEAWAGLWNDERVLMERQLLATATVLEIQRVRGDRELECVDLLSGDERPFTVVDRSLARKALRFTRLLTRVWHSAHLSRIAGVGILLHHGVWPLWRQRLRERIDEEELSRNPLAEREFVTEHLPECMKWVGEIARERRSSLLASMDLHQCVATYNLTAPRSEVLGVLRSLPDFEEDEEPEALPGFPRPEAFFFWLRRGASKRLEEKMPAYFRHEPEDEGVGGVGGVRVYPDRLVVETFSKQKHAFAKKMLKELLGARVRFAKESFEDLAKKVIRKIESEEEFHGMIEEDGGPPRERGVPAPEENQVPLEVRQPILKDLHQRHYRAFLEDRLPALDGLTPREAACDPRMRGRLVELMKGHLYGLEETRRRDGVEIDLGWVLDELGLSELK